MRPFTRITALLLAVVSFSHLLRLLLGWDILVNNMPVPMWVSVLGVIVPGALAILIWRESKH